MAYSASLEEKSEGFQGTKEGAATYPEFTIRGFYADQYETS